MKNANTPAAPTSAKISDTGDALAYQIGGDATFQFPGLTKLEKISARIMAGFAVDPDIDAVMAQEVVKSAVMLAYALPAELEK